MEIAYFDTEVKAGFPSPSLDYFEERIDLNKILIEHPEATFIVESSGDSMINAFIPPKSKLIVDRAVTPQNGNIVLAVINGEFLVKFLKKNDFKCWLISANSKYKDIEITPEMNLIIWGVVIYIITDSKEVRKCMR